MQIVAKASELQIVRMPDGVDGTKCIKARYIGANCAQFVCYLNLEPGETDYTGYAKTRLGIGFRMHMVRNGNAPRMCIIEPQDDPIPQDYKILMVCLDSRGLPVKNAVNETQRFPFLVFEDAHDAAEYEEFLIREYDAPDEDGRGSRPAYVIRSWQEGSAIETCFTDLDAAVELDDNTTLEDL